MGGCELKKRWAEVGEEGVLMVELVELIGLIGLIGEREEGQKGRWVDGSCSPGAGGGGMEGRAVGGGMIVK